MADKADREQRRPDDQQAKPAPAHSGEDEVFPEGFRKLMRIIFGPWNRG